MNRLAFMHLPSDSAQHQCDVVIFIQRDGLDCALSSGSVKCRYKFVAQTKITYYSTWFTQPKVGRPK